MILRTALIVLMTFFINASSVPAQANKNIEMYDIEQKIVIKTITRKPYIQKNSEIILQGISDVYKKINPIPIKGLMVKIPLDPSIHVSNQWIDSIVDELIVFFPEEEEPFIMVYDDENNIYFFSIDKKVNTANLFLLLLHH
ncbi:hypothetical protein ACFYKT_13095 [Cytobacillus sp. FJAT-53684]|uniref:Group-specific protein n=1 Tax=Cytobacillus mangrovibacter TaxID=3299024 RepID=A0ABW6JZD7_9BACI